MLTHIAFAISTLVVAELPERTHGNVMGDGLGLTVETDPQAGGVCADGDTVFGIDVSYYQGDIDWNAVAADGVKFAIIRVSHSTQFFDPQFDANLAGSRAAGIHTGVYQFFQPEEDPVAQADLLLEHLGPLQPGDLPPMIDVEATGGLGGAAIASSIQAWIDRVEGELGVKPLLYSGYYFWNDNVASDAFGEYPLIVPWYGVDCPGGVPIGWDKWSFHQYCDCGSIAGIAGNVDVDRFNGSLADLEALTSMPVCGDGTCSGTETPYTCAGDCSPCGTISRTGSTIDNDDACYGLYGSAEYWRNEAAGEGGSLVWTHATNYDMPYNYAVWQLDFAESGRYELEVHVPQPFGQSKMAAYQVTHAAGDTVVPIDQSANDGWVSLGEFQFTADTDQRLRLDDNTGEADTAMVQLVFDAIRLTRLDLDPSGTDDGGSDDSGGGSATAEGTEGGSEDVGEPEPGESSSAIDPTFAAEDDGADDGCGCRSGGAPAGWLLGLAGVAAMGVRRRRTG